MIINVRDLGAKEQDQNNNGQGNQPVHQTLCRSLVEVVNAIGLD
jgi:hypothetical protein